MTTTMQLIAKQTVGSGGAASVTFSNIPDSYTDLKVMMSTRNASTGSYFNISFNGVTTNRSNIRLYSNGSTAASYSGSDLFVYSDYASRTANTFDNIEMYIPNYRSSSYKSISIDDITENNASGAEMALIAGLWSSTAAVTSISFTPDVGSFDQYTTFYLYGISNSTTTQATTVPYASGGDVITTDGTYWYHAFKYSGSFTPLKNLTADVLTIAGGGSGGAGSGAGGGAGGLLYSASQALTSTSSYVCTIGAGGPGVSATSQGNNGVNSTFIGGVLSLTATGGGRGSANGGTPGNGGSGGGGSDAGSQAGGTGISGQGFAGGTGSTSGGGGGGGAGAVGNIGSGGSAGQGGAGLNTYSSWATATSTGVSGYYAGGGSGYVSSSSTPGGSGGGGNSGTSASQTDRNGVPNTGSGGGAWPGSGTSGLGGSGIIIVRYAV